MIKARDTQFLELRKDRNEAMMNDKRYITLTSNKGHDEKLIIRVEELMIEQKVLDQLKTDDYVIAS
jgi:hypothetical protein